MRAELGGGVYNNTPVIADGCLYLADSSGALHALNADSGDLVWTVELDLPCKRLRRGSRGHARGG
jgi:outer membrane protein assembly factor BamB